MAADEHREGQSAGPIAREVPYAQDAAAVHTGAEVPLCTHCVQPVHPFATRCPHCDEPIGSSTMLPFEGIHAEMTFLARAARLVSSNWIIVLVLVALAVFVMIVLE